MFPHRSLARGPPEEEDVDDVFLELEEKREDEDVEDMLAIEVN